MFRDELVCRKNLPVGVDEGDDGLVLLSELSLRCACCSAKGSGWLVRKWRMRGEGLQLGISVSLKCFRKFHRQIHHEHLQALRSSISVDTLTYIHDS